MRPPRMQLIGLAFLVACTAPSGPSEPTEPTGVIYFEYQVPGSGQPAVWRVLPDGSGLGRVPHPFEIVLSPHVGLSGRWLAYVESGDVFVADLSNPPGWPELPQKDITFTGLRSNPLVSQTGRYVANTYAGPDPELRGIRISRNDQSGFETYLLPPSRESGSPERAIGWFPGDDSLLIVERRPDREYSIIHTDGSGKRTPAIPSINGYVSVALSPTGRFLALAGPLSANPGDDASHTILICELASSRRVRSVSAVEPVHEVLWSPDERFLAYVPFPDAGDRFDLGVIDLATGTEAVALDVPQLIQRPVWANPPPLP